jgi:hypothetical protein
MRVTPWLIGAAAAAMIGFSGTAASAAPAAPGLKAAVGEASAVEKAHGYRRWRRHYGFYGVPYVYFGPRYDYRPYWHRPYWRGYGFYHRPWVGYRRYWW